MSRSLLEPVFLDGSRGRLFALLRAKADADQCVLFVPPFAEEMNKTRKMVTETSQRLVESGLATLVVDLFGTGDSEGCFEDARWSDWKSDVLTALDWIRSLGYTSYGLVAARLGCVLAADALRDLKPGFERSVFWQPISSGRQFINQFLRLRVAAAMLEGGGARTSVESLRQALSQGEVVSVSGYGLCEELAQAIDDKKLLDHMGPALGELAIIEIGSSARIELSAGARNILTRASQAGLKMAGSRLAGEPFWSATEIVVNSKLCEETAKFIVRV